jgi:hypothetical protein
MIEDTLEIEVEISWCSKYVCCYWGGRKAGGVVKAIPQSRD